MQLVLFAFLIEACSLDVVVDVGVSWSPLVSLFVPATKLHCCIFKESKVFGGEPNRSLADQAAQNYFLDLCCRFHHEIHTNERPQFDSQT